MNKKNEDVAAGFLAFVAVLVGLVLLVGVGFVGCGQVNNFRRAQKLKDVKNKVKITQILIRNAKQRAKVVTAQDAIVKARADQKLIEARGIRHAQDEISATLTDRYLQHEAIKAQLAMAKSPNHTQVYIPSGNNGIPVVQTAPKP